MSDRQPLMRAVLKNRYEPLAPPKRRIVETLACGHSFFRHMLEPARDARHCLDCEAQAARERNTEALPTLRTTHCGL